MEEALWDDEAAQRATPQGEPVGTGLSVEIKNSEDLRHWLKDRPREDAVAIAARAALRALPLLITDLDEDAGKRRADLVLPAFRLMAAPWVAAVGPAHGAEVREAAYVAARAALDAAPAARAALDAAPAAADLAAAATQAGVGLTANPALADAVYAATPAPAGWEAVSADATVLEQGQSAEQVAARRLWPEKLPNWAADAWAKLEDHLLKADEGWRVWADWYDDRLHGRPYNMALEEARVLIPDEIWDQGPKAVNAEIARLIELYNKGGGWGEQRLPPLRQSGSGAPDLPDQRPTPIRFEFRDGALRLAPHEPPRPPEDRRAAAESAWQAIRDMLNDYLTSGGGRQNPRLATALRRSLGAMGEKFEALDVVLLGVHGARLQGFADRADEVLIPEDAAELVTLNVQLALFLAQFPEWADYASGIGDGFGTPQAEQQAVADAIAAFDQIEQEAPNLIAPDAREGLSSLAEAATTEPTPDDPEPVAPPVERRSYLRAARSALRALSAQALANVRVSVEKGIQKSVEVATVTAIAGVTGYAVALAAGLPGEYGWFAAVATYLTRMLGPSSAGQPDKSVDTEGDDDMTNA